MVNYDSFEPALKEVDMDERERVVPVMLADGTVVHISATTLGGDEDVADLKGALPSAKSVARWKASPAS